MKITQFDSIETWMEGRRGRVTGSRLKDVLAKRGGEKKIGFYEMIAERLGIAADSESAMERGHRLEGEAVEAFEKATGKKVERGLVIWSREDNESIAISPDGWIGDTAAVECKCLSSARHIQAVLTNEIPDEYKYQVRQYFVVSDELRTLYMVFYDPRLLAKPYFCIEVKREDVQIEVDELLAYQKELLETVEEIVLELSNF